MPQGLCQLIAALCRGKTIPKDPNSTQDGNEDIERLDGISIEASEPQVRRDIHAALKLGPLPTW